MADILHAASRFRKEIFARDRALYQRLARDGQSPKALIIACADSRVAPEHITQAAPGEIFVCRNAGNIVPPFAQMNGGVSSAIEYAVVALRVEDIVVCGHSGCGAMKALRSPSTLGPMPNVAAWLRHASAAQAIVCEAYPAGMTEEEAVRALAMENVVVQINHLRTHPAVAARLARGEIRLHGWYFDIETGAIHAADETGVFSLVEEGEPTPVAVAPGGRAQAPAMAAE
ncbi:MAG TPA: carbonic anhydrase [Hansschlegelia sp.]